MSDDRVVVIVEIGDNCVSPSYRSMKTIIVNMYETAMFLALIEDKVNKMHVAVCETLNRSIALGYCFRLG